MALFIPAILAKEKTDYQQFVVALAPLVAKIQVDFADQTLVANQTVLPAELDMLDLKIVLEAHLMVDDPVKYLPSLAELGYTSVVIHQESQAEIGRLMVQAQQLGLSVGIAINPATGVDQLRPETNKAAFIQVMGVEPGFGGQAFQPAVLEKLSLIKRLFNHIPIAVDGGVRLDNVQSIVKAGADYLVVGKGGWFNDGDITTGIKRWQEIVTNMV